MSEPRIDHSDSLQGAMDELISAISSLNSDASPIQGATGCLSETDQRAGQAMRHLHAVSILLRHVSAERAQLSAELVRLRESVRKTFDLVRDDSR